MSVLSPINSPTSYDRNGSSVTNSDSFEELLEAAEEAAHAGSEEEIARGQKQVGRNIFGGGKSSYGAT